MLDENYHQRMDGLIKEAHESGEMFTEEMHDKMLAHTTDQLGAMALHSSEHVAYWSSRHAPEIKAYGKAIIGQLVHEVVTTAAAGIKGAAGAVLSKHQIEAAGQRIDQGLELLGKAHKAANDAMDRTFTENQNAIMKPLTVGAVFSGIFGLLKPLGKLGKKTEKLKEAGRKTTAAETMASVQESELVMAEVSSKGLYKEVGGVKVHNVHPDSILDDKWLDAIKPGEIPYVIEGSKKVYLVNGHHVVHKQFKEHEFIKRSGFDIDDRINIINLPTDEGAKYIKTSRTVHSKGPHDERVVMDIFKELKTAKILADQNNWTAEQYKDHLLQIIKNEGGDLSTGKRILKDKK